MDQSTPHSRRHVGTLRRSVARAVGMFGSVELLKMVCSLVRNKLIAVWVGPAGVGLVGLYTQALQMLSAFGDMGLRVSGVREIAQADEAQIARRRRVVRVTGYSLGILAAALTAAFSPLLSQLTFGDYNHCWAFLLVGSGVFLQTVGSIESTILQGRGMLRRIAVASAISIPVSLAVSVPLIYYYRMEGMLAVVMAYAAVNSLSIWACRDRQKETTEPKMTLRQTYGEGAEMVKMGLMITVSAIVTWVAGYAVLAYLNISGGSEVTGLYQTGYTIVINYVGLAFSVMALEYYPRLSAAAKAGDRRVATMMRYQIKAVMIMLLPVAAVILLLAPQIVGILYSGAFTESAALVRAAAPGIVLRGVSWAMAFVILAKGAKRLYLITELTSSAVCVAFSIVGYRIGGIAGIGWAFTLWYLVYLLTVGVCVWRRLGVTPTRGQLVWVSLGVSLLSAAAAACLS